VVHIKVDDRDAPGRKIIDQTSVIEVDRDPAGACQRRVQIEDRIEAPADRRRR
jgi:hypothetical protein